MPISSASHPSLSQRLTADADRAAQDLAPDLRIARMPLDPLTPSKDRAIRVEDLAGRG